MRITTLTLAAAISLTVFACSNDDGPDDNGTSSSSVEINGGSSSSGGAPSSSSSRLGGGSSSSGNATLSSSSDIAVVGRACEGYEDGVLFACSEFPSDTPDMQKHKDECEADAGIWANVCPSGEKATCIDEDDILELPENTLFKLYTEILTCSDLLLKNADGGIDGPVAKGGACGPFDVGTTGNFACVEFPELPTAMVKFECESIEVPFASECPSNADLICHYTEEETINHFYGERFSLVACGDMGMEEP